MLRIHCLEFNPSLKGTIYMAKIKTGVFTSDDTRPVILYMLLKGILYMVQTQG